MSKSFSRIQDSPSMSTMMAMMNPSRLLRGRRMTGPFTGSSSNLVYASENAEPNHGTGHVSSSADLPPPTQPTTTNIILFGETGVGKSSVINLIAQRKLAKVSSNVNGCTMESTPHDITFDGMDFTIFDTIGLEEPEVGVNGYLKAIEKAFKLITKLEAAGGIHLLLFCMRGGRITATTQSNYRMFYECLCQRKVPMALIFTGLENEVNMEDWWRRNNAHIKHYGIHSQGHACVTAVHDGTSEELAKYNESQTKIRELIKSCALKSSATLPEPYPWFARFAKGMMGFIKKGTAPGGKKLVKILTQRCHLAPDVAQRIVDMMEQDIGETDLDITARQRRCEELYEEAPTNEGISSLLEMLAAFDKEADMSEPVIDWLSDFKLRFCKKLEHFGGVAMDAQRYDEAISHYSTALFLNAKSQDLFIQRSKARMAKGLWHDALNDLNEAITRDPSEPGTDRLSDFKLHFCEKLGRFGGVAMDAQRYDEAISHYSTALSLNPKSQDLFIQRSKARMAKGLWKEALNDVNEAIARDPSSPWGYETKHAILHKAKSYVEAVDAFETMLLKMEQSPDPKTRERRELYVSPSSTRTKIRKIVQRNLRRSPHVLINTSTGRLQNRTERASTFESLPVFNELLSSMTTTIDLGRIKHEVKQHFRYVMLSHKWEENEPLFQQVIHMAVYDLRKSPTHQKLQTFCTIVRNAGFNWAWSDTCCIDKQDRNVHREALVAMFQWYRGSAMVIVYLRGVRSPGRLGDLTRSIWNTRAWTFQEYVSSKVVRFYTEDWTPYRDLQRANHKESPEIISEMEEATRVSAQQLMALRPGLSNIREKLYLASTRQTSLVEDVAYSLLGIFSVTDIAPNYGEGESALGRLLAHLLSGSGDVSILAWTGHPGGVNSCLPARLAVYSQPVTSHLPRVIKDAEMDNAIVTLRNSALNLDLAVRLYDHLGNLPTPRFTANRMMSLPCMAFRLSPFSQTHSVYRAESPAFGTVEIKTRHDLTRLQYPCLVHPWLNDLLGREDTHVGTSVRGDVPKPSSSGVDDEDLDDEDTEDDASSLHAPELPLASVSAANHPLDRGTQALQLIVRLRQPFGALLFTQTAMGGRVVYQRVEADSLITVQIQKNVRLEDLVSSVCTLDVV